MGRRNEYSGECYRCRETVESGQGHIEKTLNGWRVQHAECAIKHRGTDFGKTADELRSDEEMARRRDAALVRRLIARSQETGKSASKARKELNRRGVEFPTPPHLLETPE